jgi:hypothetical protein
MDVKERCQVAGTAKEKRQARQLPTAERLTTLVELQAQSRQVGMKVAGGCPSTVEVESGGSNSGGGVTWTQVRFKKEKDGSVASWLDGAVPQHGRCCKPAKSCVVDILAMCLSGISLATALDHG